MKGAVVNKTKSIFSSSPLTDDNMFVFDPTKTLTPTEEGTVLYFDSYNLFPQTGEVDNLYVDNSDGVIYTWNVELNDYKSEGKTQIQSDWNEPNTSSPAYIRNRPVSSLSFSPFITKWNITTTGETVTLPLKANTSYDFEVDWGDGSTIQQIKSFDDVQKTHTYSAVGVYEISIKGTLEFFGYPRGHAKTYQIIEIVQWGDIEWKEVVFYECMTLAAIPQLEAPNFLRVTSLLGLFETCPITQVSNKLLEFAKNVTQFNLFMNDSAITEIPIGFFDNCLSAVDFGGAFKGSPITTLPTGLFKGSINAKSFSGCFRGCPLNAIPEDIFSSCILAENFSDVFYQFTDGSSNITQIPKNLFKYNKRANNFRGAFKYFSNLGTTEIPELWIDFPNADGAGCFDVPTTVSNYNKIPNTWGGTFTGTYPQLPIEMRAYWHETLQKPIWKKADGTYVDATGTIV